MLNSKLPALAALFSSVAWSAPASGTACVACHENQAKWQPETSMARALLPLSANTTLNTHAAMTFRRGGYSYTVERRGGTPTYVVTDANNSLAVPIRWAFGARSQTWVLDYQGRMYESQVSYYSGIDGLDVTMGDQDRRPATLVDAMGRLLSAGETRACFSCHATAAVADDEIQSDSLKPGVQCEHCHTGASAHLQAIAHQKLDSTPPKLATMSAEQMSNFCGRCHRTFSDVVRNRLFGAVNIRFQPYRLAKSRCYDGSDARMSCVACHDPHREVTTSAAPELKSYDAKCLACHASPSAKAGAKSCPKATSGCVGCHMPKIELAGAHQKFTDHDIRIVRAGEAYPD